jgi:TetR/AcrR family transcriptional repressor of nem operon
MPVTAPLPADTVITSSEKRDEIISSAISLFMKKGLGETSIDDIVNEAHIGKGTFYRYFKDKNELFIECADSVFHEMYRNVWEEIKNEKDMMRRLQKRLNAFFDAYPRWIDMMNLVRYASVGSDPFFKNKFRAVLNNVTRPIARDLEVLKKEGRVLEGTDCLEAAYMLLGMAEYAAALIHSGKHNAAEIIDIMLEFTSYGLRGDPHQFPFSIEPRHPD